MGHNAIGLLLRLSLVLILFCTINLFFVSAGQPEFYILLITIGINAIVIICTAVIIRKKKNDQSDE